LFFIRQDVTGSYILPVMPLRWFNLPDPLFLNMEDRIMVEKSFKQVCACTHCGNEAEMVVTCSLDEHRHQGQQHAPPRIIAGKDQGEGHVIKGHAVCSQCGGEADIWLDV
jgi:hypothetical protein